MLKTYNTITINETIDKVFHITNDLERWPEMFKEYTSVKVLSSTGKKVTFQITDAQGKTWVSSRFIDDCLYICAAEREEPKFPFKYMHILWKYCDVDGKTEMIWTQYFEVDEAAGVEDEKALQFINNHSKENMLNIKNLIESGKLMTLPDSKSPG